MAKVKTKNLILSKSKIMKGLQCPKQLWLTIYEPDIEDEIDESRQLQFDEGNEVGELARKLEGKGVLIDCEYWDYKKAAKLTDDYINQGEKLIYEAAFLKNDLFFRTDILKKTKSGWHIIEVKKSTEVKEEYVQDCAIQLIIAELSGLEIKTISLRHINNEMIYPDFDNFFITEDITDAVREMIPLVKKEIAKLKKIIAEKKEPKIEIREHCDSPYECSFKAYCWKHVPEFSVFDLPKLQAKKKWELYDDNILKITELSADDYSGITKRAIEVTKKKKLFIDKSEVENELKKWKWPLYFFDFETINPAIPRYKGASPYLHVPFQFSCHVWKKNDSSNLYHHEFLHTENSDPRKDLIQSMLKVLGKKGSIVSYNKGFETGVIKKLAEFDKKNKEELLALIDRFVDPLPIFQKHVYHKDFLGSFSIKSVAPALIGERLNYENLEIGDGGTAQVMASLVMFGNLDKKEKDKIIKNLLIYCHQDTLAMVELVKWLVGKRNGF